MGRTNKIPRTDSGWAWVVDCGAFIAYFTSIGYVSSLSVYLTIWMDYFEASATTVGLVVSMGILMRGLMSPLSGALCTKLGPRVVTMAGGVIFVTGAVLSSLSPTIGFLIVSNGLTASGGSMLYVAEVQALGMYFKKRFAFAVGLASAGISTGQLAFPPLVTYLIEVYGWHGSMLITAAINMHIVAAGALMRPMVRGKTTKKRRAHSVTKQNPGKNETCTDETDPEDTMAGRDSEVDEIEEDVVTFILAENLGFVEAIRHQTSDDGTSSSSLTETPRSCMGCFFTYFSRLKHYLLDTYGLRRFVRNTAFILTITVAFFHGFGRLSIVYIVPRANSAGIDLETSALLLSLFGAGSIVGRIGYGWFIDKKYITGEMAYTLALFIFSVTVSLMPAFSIFPPLAVLALLLGAAAGLSASVVMIIVRAQVQQSDAAGALGIMLLFMCVGNVIGIFVSGVTYDTTDRYDIAFFTGGAILLIAMILCLVVYFLQKAKQKKPRLNLPPAFYVKFPRSASTGDHRKQTADSVTADLDLDGLNDDDTGVSNPVCTFVLSGISTDDNVAGQQQIVGLKRDQHSSRRRFGRKVEAGKMKGIENPMAVDHFDDVIVKEDENTDVDQT